MPAVESVEPTPSSHPYVQAWLTRDLDAWSRAWAPGFRLYSPILSRPFEGRDAARELFGVLFARLADVEIVERLGGGDALAVALSINVGSALVDVSPLSTLGALCVAAVAEREEARALFQGLLVWGLSMTVVGALLCQLLAGTVARL